VGISKPDVLAAPLQPPVVQRVPVAATDWRSLIEGVAVTERARMVVVRRVVNCMIALVEMIELEILM
jgi:hypothetical protein